MKRLEKGIYLDGTSIRAKVSVGSGEHVRAKEKRFPLTTPRKLIREWREDTRKALRAKLKTRTAHVGSLRSDALRYLALVKHMPSYASRRGNIESWLLNFGDRRRDSISEDEVRVQLLEWKAEGLAASTLNHRKTALSQLYVTLDGPKAYNPTKGFGRFKEPEPQPRGQDLDALWKVLWTIQPSASKARILALLFTGMRPAQLKDVKPRDVRIENDPPFVVVRSAKGGVPQDAPLTREGCNAFEMLEHFDGFGKFDTTALNRLWKRSTKDTPLAGMVLYDLRHSFATAVLAAGADLADVGALLGHKPNSPATRRYAPVQKRRLIVAVQRAFAS